MFELEDYSMGFHDGFLSKYADSSGPTLDCYISDSMQDILDVDIRSEIANVVGGSSNELASLVNDLPSSLDHALEAISAINNSTTSANGLSSASAVSSAWFGANSGPSWSSSNDFYADVGACVNPQSVMPMISSSIMHLSPKTNLNANGLRSANSPPPPSPNINETKSHLTFSPAQVKVPAGAIRNEQALSHIPKQIVSISSNVTAATTAPATLATNSALQRRNVDTVKKDLVAEMKKSANVSATVNNVACVEESRANGNGYVSNSIINNNNNNTSTIKLAPGIGCLTFANSITYNKLKQQSLVKSPQGSPIATNGGTIVLKRERGGSPLQTANGGGSQPITKLLGRSIVQPASSYTPKSIASAHSPLMHSGGSSVGSSSSRSSSVSSPTTVGGSFSAINANGFKSATATGSPNGITAIAVKPLHQKIKAVPFESEYPKPAYSYSCLIAMALKNSRSGSLPVSEIYSFMCEHFPYFQSAPSGWKNSVRHNLSLNKCFEKIEKPCTNGNQRKGCLWAMNPERVSKMDEEVQKWSRKDPMAILNAMVFPEHLEALERGEMKHGSTGDSDVELDSQSDVEETSDLEEHELDDAIVDNMFVEEDIEELDDDMIDNGTGLLGSSILLVNATDGDSGRSSSGGTDADDDVIIMSQHQKGQRDFDIEVEDLYDAIDLDDERETGRITTIHPSDIIELSPADLKLPAQHSNDYQSPKRARFNINYSIGPAGEFEKQFQQHQQQQTTAKAIKVQALQQHAQQQQSPGQHIVVQTITNGGTTTTLQPTSMLKSGTTHFHQHITAIPSHNRRKMQLVNRIA